MVDLALRLSPLLLAATLVPAQSGWSAPVLETALNSMASDSGPHLSFDGLTIHFSSFVSGNWEIYSATRPGPGGAWSAPVFEAAVSDPVGTDDQPFLMASGLELYFGSTRGGGAGSFDILRAQRTNPGAPWGAPTFVTELNSMGAESSPSLTADGLEVYFLTTGWGAPFAPQNSIFRATRASTSVPFGTPAVVSELLTPNTHRDVEIAWDGLSIVYTEFISPSLEVMFAERTNRSMPFGTPVVLTEFSNVGSRGVFSFTRSVTGNEAFLAASFPAASGAQEIMSSRFDGLTHSGVATSSSRMNLHYRDSGSPGLVYFLGAALGNTGFMVGTRLVPLDPDFLLIGTFGNDVPPFSGGFAGMLDPGGEASGFLTNAGGALTGFQIWVGGFTLDLAAPFGVRTISNSFQVEFQ